MRRLNGVLSHFPQVNILDNQIAVWSEGFIKCAGWSESLLLARAISVIWASHLFDTDPLKQRRIDTTLFLDLRFHRFSNIKLGCRFAALRLWSCQHDQSASTRCTCFFARDWRLPFLNRPKKNGSKWSDRILSQTVVYAISIFAKYFNLRPTEIREYKRKLFMILAKIACSLILHYADIY